MAVAAAILPRPVFGSSGNLPHRRKILAFYNIHTAEKLKTVYWAEGNYLADSLREINHVLRDPRNNEIHDIDTRLLDLLFAIRQEIETNQPFHVISGYPHAGYQRFSARPYQEASAEKVCIWSAKQSTFRSPGKDLRSLHKVAMTLKGGGVGYYPKSDFVHVDIGRARYW